MTRKNPNDTVEYNRTRYLELKAEKKDENWAKGWKRVLKIGQKISIGKAICVEITPHYYDFAIQDFIGSSPLIRIDRKAVEMWVKKQKKKKIKKGR